MDESYYLRESDIVEENQGEDFYFWLNPDGSLPFPGTRGIIICFVSSVRTSNSHPDLLLTQQHPHFFRSQRSSTLDFHFLSHYSYIKAIMLYKGNHWTQCAGFMDASWVRLGITNDDLGTSWALPGDNLGMTWG